MRAGDLTVGEASRPLVALAQADEFESAAVLVEYLRRRGPRPLGDLSVLVWLAEHPKANWDLHERLEKSYVELLAADAAVWKTTRPLLARLTPTVARLAPAAAVVLEGVVEGDTAPTDPAQVLVDAASAVRADAAIDSAMLAEYCMWLAASTPYLHDPFELERILGLAPPAELALVDRVLTPEQALDDYLEAVADGRSHDGVTWRQLRALAHLLPLAEFDRRCAAALRSLTDTLTASNDELGSAIESVWEVRQPGASLVDVLETASVVLAQQAEREKRADAFANAESPHAAGTPTPDARPTTGPTTSPITRPTTAPAPPTTISTTTRTTLPSASPPPTSPPANGVPAARDPRRPGHGADGRGPDVAR